MHWLLLLALLAAPAALTPAADDAVPARVELLPARATLKAGETLELELAVRDVSNLYSGPFHLVYDADRVEVEDILEGNFLNGDGRQTVFMKSIQAERGRAIVGLVRLGQVGGRSGSGRLATIRVKAKKPGTVELKLERMVFQDPELKPIAVRGAGATLTIQD
jgi:hypothetical protein